MPPKFNERFIAMKVGDLVKPAGNHGLQGEAYRSVGVVVEVCEGNPHAGVQESVTILWNDGEMDLEWPPYLEVVNESR